jgi:hypothetical protein
MKIIEVASIRQREVRCYKAARTTFGTKGVTMVGFTNFINEPNSVAVQPDGDIVVVGFSETTSGGVNFAMARFTPNGQLDDTFGHGGLVTVQPADAA